MRPCSGSGLGCAAGWTTTSTGSASSGTWPARPTRGTPWAARTASSIGATRLTRTLEWRDRCPARPQRHRGGLPRGLLGACRSPEQRAAQERSPPRASDQPPAAGRPGRRRRPRSARPRRGRASPCAAPTARRATATGPAAAADLADARRAGAVALEHEDLSHVPAARAVGAPGRHLGAGLGQPHAAVLMRSPSLLSVRDHRRVHRRPDGQPRRRAARSQPAGRGRGSAPDGCRHPRTHAVRGRHPRQRYRLLPRQQPAGDGGEPVDRERPAARRGSTHSRSGCTTCRAAPSPTEQLGGFPEASIGRVRPRLQRRRSPARRGRRPAGRGHGGGREDLRDRVGPCRPIAADAPAAGCRTTRS